MLFSRLEEPFIASRSYGHNWTNEVGFCRYLHDLVSQKAFAGETGFHEIQVPSFDRAGTLTMSALINLLLLVPND